MGVKTSEMDWSNDDREFDEEKCCFPGRCCMPGVHSVEECHTAEMLEEIIAQSKEGSGNDIGR